MLKPRIIPCLLVQDQALVKTVNFRDPKYVGDPLNAVRIFNEKEADGLMVVDISATAQNRKPNFKLIENLACECRMPLCYGGGVKTIEDARRILALGVEKVALSSGAIENPTLVKELAAQVGSQSVVVVLDVAKSERGSGYACLTHNGTRATNQDPLALARSMQSLGVGEIVVNSITDDGTMRGYNLQLVREVRANLRVPLTVLGGAGSLDDVRKLIQQERIIGAAAGSLFVFKGKYRAVLISYPSRTEKNGLQAPVPAGGG